jgi:chromate reductase
MAQMKILGLAGSLRRASYNGGLIRAAVELAPAGMTVDVFDLGELPLYNQDIEDAGEPVSVVSFKRAIAEADALLVATPEYNHGVPGVLKNAIDWASRPWGQNAFDHIPAGVIGASIGQIGTAVAQQSLRAVLSFCNARQMTAPEAYIQYSTELFPGDGEIAAQSTKEFLTNYMAEFRDHIERVLTVLPRQQ